MKKLILILLAAIGINFYLSAQSAGDYRSIGSGNWNDPTKWETFNGSSWITASNYPGQNPGTGSVTISGETTILITANVSYPITNLFISGDYYYYCNDEYCYEYYVYGYLKFSAESAISLTVPGDIEINGQLSIENQNGAKTHSLFVGGSFYAWGLFHSFQEDDKLAVIFNTIDPNSWIAGYGYVSFYDITFNGAGIRLSTSISIAGAATFINGIVRSQSNMTIFDNDATASGSSIASFIIGAVQKNGDDPFTFPIGANGVYGPLTMSAPVEQESFWATYQRTNAANYGVITDPELYSLSNCENWVFYKNYDVTAINYPLDITVGWTTTSGCGSPPIYIPNVSEVTIARYNGASWNSHGGTGTGSPSNGFVTWNDITSVGFFTLGNVGVGCGTPSGLTSNVSSNAAIISWSPVSDALSYTVGYKSALSNIGESAGSAITATSVILSGLSPSVVYDWNVRANCSLGSSIPRQASFTTTTTLEVCNDVYETNNLSSQARTINVGNAIFGGITSTNDVDWFKVTTPNNSNINLAVTLSNLPADYDLYVYNKSLKLVGSSTNSGTSNDVVIYNSNARKATYYIKVVGKNGAYNTSQCYNLLVQVSSTAGSASGKSYPANEVTDISDKQLLYPNPASEFVYLNFNSATEGLVNIQIVNSIGQLVKQHPVNTIKGHNQIKIQVADIRPGMYILRINKGDLNLTRKFVVAR